MKTINNFLIIITAIIFVSCSKDENIGDTNKVKFNKNLTTNSNLLSVGELHNEGLTYIYENNIKNIDFQNEDKLNEIVSNKGWEYIESHYGTDLDTIKQDIHSIYSNHYSGTYATEISSALQLEINKLVNYVNITITENNASAGNDIFEHSRDLLKNSPPEGLNEYEIEAWKSAVDVMGYSAMYWTTNFETWQLKIKGNGKETTTGWIGKLWKKVKKVVVSDLVGARTGFVKGFLKTGTWTGAGAGALSGGMGSSAGTTILEILKDIF